MFILRFVSIATIAAGLLFVGSGKEAAGFTLAVLGAGGLTASYVFKTESEVEKRMREMFVPPDKEQSWLRTYDELVPSFRHEIAFQMESGTSLVH